MPERRGPHHVWYGLGRWKKLRAHQLAEQPLCESCLRRNIATPAEVADHVVPHRGDEELGTSVVVQAMSQWNQAAKGNHWLFT
jgi:5-methylcytosine-specific restriction enzyme A